MAIKEMAEVEVQVNSQQAKEHLKDLEAQAASLQKQMREAFEAGDTKHLESLRKELKSVQSEIRTTKKDTTALTEVMHNLDKATPKELRATLKAINRELNSGHVQRGSKEWKYYQEQAKLVTRELNNIKNETRESMGFLDRFNNSLSKWGGLAASAAAAITGVAMTLNSLRNNRNNKEDAQHELKALTGLGDDSIAWLTEQAEILSTTMEKSGLRIRQSSEEILKAYMMVGSKKPELLGDKEALNAVTIEAMRLAAAAKIDLTEAVDATTVSLNMFGENADQAAKYVNVLAAGSKAGSATVAAQTAAIKNAGVAAAGAGVTIEQLNGVIQTLAKKGIEAEPAGTALRKFFLVLQTGAKETNPAIVGLDKAIENLAAQELSAAEIKEKFGEEAYSAASIIINSTEDYKHFTDAVTDTNVALEQAAINSDTASAKMEQHKNRIKEAGIELMERLNPSLSVLTGWTSKIIAALPRLIDWFIEYKNIIIASATAITAYTVVVKAHTIATKAQVLWTNTLTIAQRALNAALKANPVGLVLAGITALGAYLLSTLIPNTERATAAQRAYNDELHRTKEELERFQDIESRYNNLDTLNARQRQQLKDDARAEIAIIEDKLSKEVRLYRKQYDAEKEAIKKRKGINETQRAALYKSLEAKVQEKADELDYLLKRKNKLTEIINHIPDANTNQGGKKQLKEEDEVKRYNKELIDLKKAYLESETMTREDYNRQIEDIEKRHVENMLTIAGLEPEKKQALMNKLLDLQLRFREQRRKDAEDEEKDNNKVREDSEKDAYNKMRRQYEMDVTEVTKRHYDSKSSEEDYLKEMKELRDNYYKNAIDSTEISEDQKAKIQQQIEKENLKDSEDNYKDYQNKLKSTLAMYQQIGQEFGETFAALITDSKSSLGDFFKATIQLILDSLQKVMIAAVAERQIKNIATMGFLGLAKAAGEIALITAAFETAKALIGGFEEGGYTGDGAHDEPKGVVHAGEFVANRHAVNNPSVRPVLDMIDTAQRNNTVGTLSASDLSAAIGTGNTYSTINNYNNTGDNDALVSQLAIVLKKLENRLQVPILAYTKTTGKMSISEAQNLLDKMKRNARR